MGVIYGVIATANMIELNSVAEDYNRATIMSQQHAIIKISHCCMYSFAKNSKFEYSGMFFGNHFINGIFVPKYDFRKY